MFWRSRCRRGIAAKPCIIMSASDKVRIVGVNDAVIAAARCSLKFGAAAAIPEIPVVPTVKTTAQ